MAAIYNLEAIQAERCRRSLAYFIRTFWECISADELSWNWHIDYLSEQLMQLARDVAEKKPKKHDLIINIPPGTTKSITCSVMFPIWCWINWPWMRFIASSYSGALALEHAEASRDLVRSEEFQRLFPMLRIKQDKDTKSNFRLQYLDPRDGQWKNGGNRYSTSVGGTLTGYHGHILLVDDPLDPNRAVSETELAKTNRWIDQTLSTRKVDKAVTPTILIMQRLHEDDPTGHLLSKKGKRIFHVCLPGECRNYREQVKPVELLENYRDDLLDQNRMPWSVLRDMETDLGQYGYAGQIGQHPVPAGGGMFKVDRFQVVTQAPTGPEILQVVRYWDKAGTQGDGAYTVGVKMARIKSPAYGEKFMVLDVKRGQWAPDERERIIRQTAEADGPKVVIWQEQEPGSGGKESALGTIRNLAGFVVYSDRPTGDKVFRADPYSVQVNNGNVLLLHGPWNKEFINEHEHFPFGKYKDQVDAASGAFSKLVFRKKAGTW